MDPIFALSDKPSYTPSSAPTYVKGSPGLWSDTSSASLAPSTCAAPVECTGRGLFLPSDIAERWSWMIKSRHGPADRRAVVASAAGVLRLAPSVVPILPEW